MESGAVFYSMFLWIAVLTAAPSECTNPEYWNRDAYQCAVKSKEPPIQGTNDTKIWFNEKGLLAFATTLNWLQVKSLYSGFSNRTCRYMGKVKDVTPKERRVTAQGLFDDYKTFDEIRKFFKVLANTNGNDKLVRFVSSIGKTSSIGPDIKTIQGRSIFAVHITRNIKSSFMKKPKIYIQCLIHPREWISGSVCMYFAKYLVDHENNLEVKLLLKDVEFVIVPVVNPDGYVKSWNAEDRFWRKNMRAYTGQSCQGVDLNRNFPYKWKNGPMKSYVLWTEADKCNEVYSGPQGASEPEVRAIMGYIKHIAPVYGAIDFHSYGQDVLFPYIHTKDSKAQPKHFEQLLTTACRTAHFMSKKDEDVYYTPANGETYEYTASGSFLDWAYSEGVANFNTDGLHYYRVTPLVVELRPESTLPTEGFELGKDKIEHTCIEAVDGILEFARHVWKYPIVYK